jgi:hypothetical protein
MISGVQAFSDADAKLLAVRREVIRPFYCNMCGQCDGQCRQGLPVQDVLRFVTYGEGYGQFGLGRERFRERAPEHASVRCESCLGCTVQCPHGVTVAEAADPRAGVVCVLKLAVRLVVVSMAAWAGSTPLPSCASVPGWTQHGPAGTFTADNLYEYLDGNSEGYFLCNFVEMRGVTCEKGEVTFVVDISDMGEPPTACSAPRVICASRCTPWVRRSSRAG